MRMVWLVPLMMAVPVMGQTAPAARGGATRPATGPISTPASTAPKNIDSALQALVPVDAEDMPLSAFVEMLRKNTQTNVVVNWNALATTGVTKDTPVTLHLKGLMYEQVVRTLMEVLPAKGTKANYTIS